MAVCVFPQAVLSPALHADLAALMAAHKATAFTGGFPNGSRPALGDGWRIEEATVAGAAGWIQAVSAWVPGVFGGLGVPVITAQMVLPAWPVTWHAPHTRGDGDSTVSLAHAVAQGWFDPTFFQHTGTGAHRLLAAEAAGGVLARQRPQPAV